ncbi:cobalt ECF transporter T component CbiQ [Microbacterium candidum]|uniref:Cobalt ECF transporter T component CbiQ n=1 Tax=Microbacterium candidum TaxID=3041922 RepID=A0ABT7MTE6_9MICO|nr:cobalt ECF transporter T component CbiQ [Microbacterium sp. ASV49]MDL9977717.1 cobalt ECF transporter T component CbiQ [Microbacterium sp. ASV49]
MTAVADPSNRWGYHPGSTPLHRLSPRTKLVALLLFAVIVVATPREWIPFYAAYAVFAVIVLAVARVRAGDVLRRLTIEIPFLIFALLLPIVATGPRVDVLGFSLSVSGLWGAWAILAKATLTLAMSIALVATTEPGRVVLAFGQIGLPRALTSIMTFMVRYLDLIVAESHRMRIARESRGFDAHGVRSWGILARAVASSFGRAHARGERVHLAMVSRGYDGGS